MGNSRVRLLVVLLVAFMGLSGGLLASESLQVAPFLELQARHEDNVLQVSEEAEPKQDLAMYLWMGLDTKFRPGAKTQVTARYEAAPRWFADYSQGNRQDHLLSFSFRRRLRPTLSLLSAGNLGLRVQSGDPIQEYFKQGISSQLHVQWNRQWSSQFGLQVRSKIFPEHRSADYASLMAEARLRRRLGATSTLGTAYQGRIYEGAIDPRVLVSEFNRDMDGFRQSANLWFETMLLGRVLTHWKYQFEMDIATRELQRHEPLPSEPEHTSDSDDEDDIDFNFVTHRIAAFWVWRVSARTTLNLSARHHLKRYRDWPVPGKNTQRQDNLTLVQVAAKHRLTSRLAARLEYLFEGNRSNDPIQQYSAHSVSAQFQVGF